MTVNAKRRAAVLEDVVTGLCVECNRLGAAIHAAAEALRNGSPEAALEAGGDAASRALRAGHKAAPTQGHGAASLPPALAESLLL